MPKQADRGCHGESVNIFKHLNFLNMQHKHHTLQLVMTLLVRDEADIVRENIDYHLSAGVDFIVVMDNNSVDGTTDILREYERQRVLHYIHEASDNYLQDVWITKLAHIAMQEHGADWIINNDADEFFIARQGTIKDVLKKVSTEIGAVSVKRHDFVPFERAAISSPPIEMIYRKKEALEWVTGKPIRNKVVHRPSPDMVIGRGSHTVKSISINKEAPTEDIFTFHYPVRSYEQFERKVKNVGFGWRQHQPNRKSRYTHWYKSLEEGGLQQIYLDYQLSAFQIASMLQSGELIEDRRLADILINIQQSKQ